jgi:sporulation protein YlmC with PRC-barrel domain
MPTVPELSDFRLGADVVASDGRKAGILASVLVEQEGFDPKAIVVKDESTLAGRLITGEKLFINNEVVIPIAAVESATHDGVQLSMTAREVHDQPPYISYRFKSETEGEAALSEVQALGGGLGMPQADEVANKPADQIEIDRDENVMLGTSGKRLGRVQDLLFDKGELIGVVITPEGLFKREVVVPIGFISRADDMALFADLDEASINQLQPFDADA